MPGFQILPNHRCDHRGAAKATTGQDFKAGDTVVVEYSDTNVMYLYRCTILRGAADCNFEFTWQPVEFGMER